MPMRTTHVRGNTRPLPAFHWETRRWILYPLRIYYVVLVLLDLATTYIGAQSNGFMTVEVNPAARLCYAVGGWGAILLWRAAWSSGALYVLSRPLFWRVQPWFWIAIDLVLVLTVLHNFSFLPHG